MKNLKILTLVLFFILFSNNFIFAHPGNTASDGCHYCRTNCDYWGVPWNQRHCHGGISHSSETAIYWVGGLILIGTIGYFLGKNK